MLEKTLKAFLNDYLLKIDNNASIPFYKDHFLRPYICTEYKDLNIKIKIYFYPLQESYNIIYEGYSVEIFKGEVHKFEKGFDTELLLLNLYKLIYIPKQEVIAEEIGLENKIAEIAKEHGYEKEFNDFLEREQNWKDSKERIETIKELDKQGIDYSEWPESQINKWWQENLKNK